MDSPLHFSDDEIREELARLGYTNIPPDKLHEFQKDLNKLVELEHSKGNSANTSLASSGHNSNSAVPAATAGASQMNTGNGVGAAVNGKHTQLYPEDDGPQGLRREDLDLDQKPSARPRTAPAVPGSYYLYELGGGPVPKPREGAKDFRDDVSETDSEARRMMKRKTLRKDKGGAKFIDESMTESEADSAVVETHTRMQRLLLRDGSAPRRPQSARSSQDPPPYRLDPDDPRISTPSVIYPTFDHPHTKNLRRMDPVARWHQMQQAWAMQQAPGEKSHKGLRWNVKAQMMIHDLPEKLPQRKYVPNKYVPPPDKKRKSLRWQVRMDMAQGNMPPPSKFYRDYS